MSKGKVNIDCDDMMSSLTKLQESVADIRESVDAIASISTAINYTEPGEAMIPTSSNDLEHHDQIAVSKSSFF
jgi:hypothetical protein